MLKTQKLSIFALFLSLQATATTHFGVSVTNFQRLNDPQYEMAGKDWLDLDVQSNYQSDRWRGEVNLGIRYGVQNKEFLYSMPYAYLEYIGRDTQVWVGRRQLDWNLSEQFWGLNTINLQRGFSLMETDTEGLVGMAIKGNFEGFVIEGMFSPFYLPQLNPTYDISTPGVVLTKNEWVKPPPNQVLYQTTYVPTEYNIEKPEVVDVILQESFALKMGYNWKRGEIAVYGLHKPENKIRITATGRFEDMTAKIKAKPFVNYHNVFGAQAWQKIGNFRMVGGIEVNEPSKGVDPSFVFDIAAFTPVYMKRTYLHSSLEYRKNNVQAGLFYLQLASESGEGSDQILYEPAMWRRAAGFQMDWSLSDNLRYKLHFRHDIELKDTLTKNEVEFLFSRHAGISIGAEILESPKEESFWSYYRSNDKFYGTFSLFY